MTIPMKPTPNVVKISVGDLTRNLLIESARDLMADDDFDVDASTMEILAGVLRRKIYGKLWARGLTALAMKLDVTGWLQRFILTSFRAVAMNLKEKEGEK